MKNCLNQRERERRRQNGEPCLNSRAECRFIFLLWGLMVVWVLGEMVAVGPGWTEGGERLETEIQ